MQFSGAVWDDVDGTHLAQDTDQWSALAKTAMNLPVPYKVKRFLIKDASISLSKRLRIWE
jgi:hypothetical protein